MTPVAKASILHPADRPTILIVDDETALRHALKASLTASGFIAEEARTGVEAAEFVPEHSFDLILLDLDTREISVVETCRRIRAITAGDAGTRI